VIIDNFVLLIGGAKTIISSFIHIAAFTSVTGGGEFIMEDFSGLSGGIHVYTGNENYTGECMTNPAVPYPYRVPIRSFVHIKKHAIIGSNTVIFPGVTIGEGAAVGSNSLQKTANRGRYMLAHLRDRFDLAREKESWSLKCNCARIFTMNMEITYPNARERHHSVQDIEKRLADMAPLKYCGAMCNGAIVGILLM
jgi:hypothetical protein